MTDEPIRVILADDHQVVRAGIRQFLEAAEGIKVVGEADDGDQAINMIEQLDPDVAVLDIQMPNKTGIEVTQWARANHPTTGILILTAYDDDPYIMAVLKAGANGYVLKTADGSEIVQSVHDVHEGKSALDPVIARKVMSHISTGSSEPIIEELTSREHEVLTLVGQGYTNKAIGVHLGISDRTVQGHLAKIFNKLQAASRTEAVMRAVSYGWLPADLGQLSDRE
ncbi:MAG: response regulator [Anaerolineales bacterium]